MLHSIRSLQGFTVAASDGELGKIKGAYFDEKKWVIQHLVVATGGWLNERRVLISPYSVLAVDWPSHFIKLKLTRQQIRDSPSIESLNPISGRCEPEPLEYHGYPGYWAGPSLWGTAEFPAAMEREVYEETQKRATALADEEERVHEVSYLHDGNDVIGSKVRAGDDDAGRVEDILFDDRDWSIQLMEIDGPHWQPGKHVMIPPQRIERVSPDERVVALKITLERLAGLSI